jgi:hypothetical protein
MHRNAVLTTVSRLCLQTGATGDDLVSLTCVVRFKHIERGRFSYFLRLGAHQEMQHHKKLALAWFAGGLTLVIVAIFRFWLGPADALARLDPAALHPRHLLRDQVDQTRPPAVSKPPPAKARLASARTR